MFRDFRAGVSPRALCAALGAAALAAVAQTASAQTANARTANTQTASVPATTVSGVVVTAPAVTATINNRLEAIGEGTSIQSVTITPASGGTLTTVAVKPDQVVAAGDVIATLDSGTQQNAYDRAVLGELLPAALPGWPAGGVLCR